MSKSKNLSIKIKGTLLDFNTPKVMGIINATPDSFYNQSRKLFVDDAIQQAEKMLQDGATILDIGGYSSRPGADHVNEKEELERVLPIIDQISSQFPEAILSIDTFRSEVARQSIQAGAGIINDISGGKLDAKMYQTVADLDVPYIMMHMRGTPQTMQTLTDYPNGVTHEVMKYFSERRIEFIKSGAVDLIIDPGFGFAKTLDQNYELLREMSTLQALACPILVGVSRKSMITKKLNIEAKDALNGTTVINTIALQQGGNILRVHDVKEAAECVKLFSETVLF
ncbi:dihydropteroate synthase [Flammeovirga yaeyamensis]|uniref:dihydropteroate synthase n=1 Tax=Flammeovirga yaeyamensis TaxID=367791 RepID=A0AAX1NAQ2_9BACT|nr:dihydropteroate synthase [Flammeovirga yaeyamensis]MBB3697681.1 dihydropteroate synthase [Flammeovirga yaeyamensis]NMF35959.1 dihydropteroate synthase [Flammeovirga yaeyamensis]QWG03093.1 dihydropteroate synthase [Flammeovirga yaeyamensis]